MAVTVDNSADDQDQRLVRFRRWRLWSAPVDAGETETDTGSEEKPNEDAAIVEVSPPVRKLANAAEGNSGMLLDTSVVVGCFFLL